MVPEPPTGQSSAVDDPAAELELVAQDLAAAEAEAEEIRRQIGDPGGEDSEPEDRANLITALETQEALIDSFRARQVVLQQRLGR